VTKSPRKLYSSRTMQWSLPRSPSPIQGVSIVSKSDQFPTFFVEDEELSFAPEEQFFNSLLWLGHSNSWIGRTAYQPSLVIFALGWPMQDHEAGQRCSVELNELFAASRVMNQCGLESIGWRAVFDKS
jgi:hypothetical protein